MTTPVSSPAVRAGTAPAALRDTLRAVQAVSPSLAAWAAERLFFTPARRPVPAAANTLLGTGSRFSLSVEGRRVEGWRWGHGPVVYLVHGWGGNAGRLAAFVRPLLDVDFAVVAFDAPGHGSSGRGMSSMPEFARALHAIARVYGSPHGIIAHSLGAAATGLALHWGLRARRLVLLAPPVNPADYVMPYAQALGLTPRTVEVLKIRSERRLRHRWADLDVRRMAPEDPVPLLVIHDRDDETVRLADGAAIADTWEGALHQTSGLGHSGILRDPAVVSEVVKFVSAPSDAGSPSPRDDGAWLEWALFNRDQRW